MIWQQDSKWTRSLYFFLLFILVAFANIRILYLWCFVSQLMITLIILIYLIRFLFEYFFISHRYTLKIFNIYIIFLVNNRTYYALLLSCAPNSIAHPTENAGNCSTKQGRSQTIIVSRRIHSAPFSLLTLSRPMEIYSDFPGEQSIWEHPGYIIL